MSEVRKFLINVCVLVLSVCTTFAVLTMTSAYNVSAQNTEFKMYDGGSIRLDVDNYGYSGLRFRSIVGAGWYESQGVDGAVFGMLIYPAKNGEVNTNKTSTENTKALDGANVILGYSTDREYVDATIVFDDLQIKRTIANRLNEKLNTSYTYESPEVIEKLETVKMGLYAKDFTACSYAIVNGQTVWADDSYTTSMLKVATRTLISIDEGKTEDKDGNIKQEALNYVGGSYSYEKGYVSVNDGVVVVDSIVGYSPTTDVVLAIDNQTLVMGVDYTFDAYGNVKLITSLKASEVPKYLYIFEKGSLKIVELLLVDNVISTPKDFKDYIDTENRANGVEPFNQVTVLASDIDMSEYGTIHKAVLGNFGGTFDGRGHVISNLSISKKTENVNGVNVVGQAIFGNLQSSAIIKNIVFNELKSVGYDVSSGIISNDLDGRVENIYVKFSKESEYQQIFMKTSAGNLTNAIIEMPYDENLDVDAWILENANAWGRTLLARRIDTSANGNLKNVQVITQLPLILYGTGSMAEPVDSYKNGKPITDWKNWFAYGENETKIWYDFNYFYDTNTYETYSGLGLKRGTATVQNTQVFDEYGYSKAQGKTRVWEGVRRYDTIEEMFADTNNAENVEEFKKSTLWKTLKDTTLT